MSEILAAYVYGPEGDRILATRGSKVTEYFYGIGGDLRLAKVNGVATKVPVNTPVGQVGSFDASAQMQYEFHDWNGSSRLTANASGSIVKTFQSDAFGAGSNAATDDVAQVNALDVDVDAYSAHAGARDYYPSFGVWNAPDPFGGSYDFTDPQSLNRYAYVGNSPVSYNDPTGLFRVDNAPDGPNDPYSVNGNMYDGYTEAGGVCKLCVWNLIPGLLRQGASLIGSFLAANGGGSDNGDMDRWVQNGLNASPDQAQGHAVAQAPRLYNQPAPTIDGQLRPPPTNDSNGNSIIPGVTAWVSRPGSAGGSRDVKWIPESPVPADKGKGEGQPSASWDPTGHWDIKTGWGKGKDKTIRVLPDGTRVDHWNQPIRNFMDDIRSLRDLLRHPPIMPATVPPLIFPYPAYEF